MNAPEEGTARAAYDTYLRSGDSAVLSEAVRTVQAELRAAADLHEQIERQIDLAVLLCTRGDAEGDTRSVREGKELLARTASDAATEPDQLSRALSSWANVLVAEHDRSGRTEPLEEAARIATQALDASGLGTDQRADALSALASVLIRKHQNTGDQQPLDDAMARLREALALAEAAEADQADPDADFKIHKLAVALSISSAARPSQSEHAEAVLLLRRLLDRTPSRSPLRPDRLAGLATALVHGYENFGLDDLDEALGLLTAAHATARGRLRALIAADLAAAMLTDFHRRSDRQTLDAAVGLLTEEGRQDGLGGPARSALDTRLGAVLTMRYIQFGDPDDLDDAVGALGRARSRNLLHGQDRLQFLSDLGASLHELHGRSGLTGPLEEAIEVLETGRREAGSSRAQVARALLANLGTVYLRHHEVFGDRESLDAAITCLDEAVTGTGGHRSSRAAWQASRGQAYQARYLAAGNRADLAQALASLRESAGTLTEGSAQDARSATARAALTNLAEALRLRAAALAPDDPGRSAAWQEATDVAKAALRGSAPPDEQALRLSNLGALLMDRYDADPDPAIRNRALTALREAVDTSRPEDPRHAVYLANLASACFTLGLEDGTPPTSAAADARARQLLRQATDSGAAAPLHRIWAAYTWAQLACRSGDLDEGIEAFTAAVALIPELTGPRLNRGDRERHLADLSELARDAAACALQRGRPGDTGRAVEFLEQGRGVLIAQALQGQQNGGVLRRERPELADRLDRLDAELATPEAGDQAGTAARRRQLVADRAVTIRQIRDCGVPELAGFLQPPTLGQLLSPIPNGPGTVVLVNVSDYRCDAIILTRQSLRSVPCPGLSPGRLREHLSRFDHALTRLSRASDDAAAEAAWSACAAAFHDNARWLWEELAEPVLSRLGVTTAMDNPRDAPRIWWIPTGELARFPLHAAGYHDRAAREDHASVARRVVSSYATSLTSLRQAVTSIAPEHGSAPNDPDGGQPGALIIAMPDTPALGPSGRLPSAEAESSVVSRYLPMATRLIGPDATRAKTVSAIRNASIAHLACHAVSEPGDPSRGRVLVHDGAVPITELQALPVWRRGLAFLSACNTADVRGDIPDEAVHLASAFQLIGFEHVIGTAWPVPDDTALAVTERFYAALWDPASSTNADPAAALHVSVTAVLATDPINPFPWTYVHYGADSITPPGESSIAMTCNMLNTTALAEP